MTTHDREKIIAAVKEAGFSEKQWSAMLYQSGPYEINTPTICLTDFYAIAFEAGRESLRQQLTAAQAAIKARDRAIETLEKFASTVGPSSSFWDEIWSEHEQALAATEPKP